MEVFKGYEKPKLNNPYYCLSCNKQYEERPNDMSSSNHDEYIRYLGYCGEKCVDKLPDSLFREMCVFAVENGDKVKRQHKFFLENIKEYPKKH